MDPKYHIGDTAAIFSPALIFYKDLVRQNIARALALAGRPNRLRPHVKTHKTREIVTLEREAGIDKHKCATLAEAEMLAGCGASEVFLAYNLVGPNCERMARLAAAYPACRFAVQADHPSPAHALSAALAPTGRQVEVLLDLDVGQHRTGTALGEGAVELYRLFARLPGLIPGGLHVYDGHNNPEDPHQREAAVRRLLEPVLALRALLEKNGLPVPRIVAGGTPSYPFFARLDIAGLECSPGTFVLQDHGYGTRFADLAGFQPAALLLTRVVSRPTPTRVTLDLGTKAVASDPPAGKRCFLLDVPDYEPVLHNEEHLVIETPAADRFQPGAEVYAMPAHICPTCALHRQAVVVERGEVIDRWDIVARDRVLTI